MKFQQKLVYVGIFAIGVALIIFWSRMTPRSEGFQGSEGFRMVMYGVDWCPHCVTSKPQFLAIGPTQTIGGKTVTFELINPEKTPEAVKGKEIHGFPTFHLYRGDGSLVKEYEGPRTKDGILKFLEETV